LCSASEVDVQLRFQAQFHLTKQSERQRENRDRGFAGDKRFCFFRRGVYMLFCGSLLSICERYAISAEFLAVNDMFVCFAECALRESRHSVTPTLSVMGGGLEPSDPKKVTSVDEFRGAVQKIVSLPAKNY
jgi:hypothetical protein